MSLAYTSRGTPFSRWILPQNFPPLFIRLSRDWMNSFGSKQQVNLKCRQNATWITSTWSLQGSGILHNASACHATGQNFQLYSATEGHSVSTIIYRDDVRVLHTEPVTYQEVRILQGRSPSDVSKLETIAVKSGLFKHRDLDATLVVHATERKHDDRYHFYWYFTIPTLVAILLTIMICNGYPILSNILLSRLVPYAKEIIGDHQCGFRRNRSNIDHTVYSSFAKCLRKNGNTMKKFISFL